MDSTSSFRGSRRHMLEWIDQPRFVEELNRLLEPAPVRVQGTTLYMPLGTTRPKEARLERFGREIFPSSAAWDQLRGWWLAYPQGANTPNWDFASSCLINGQPGLLLVEAKANASELSRSGKSHRLGVGRQRRPAASIARSRANHTRICSCVAEASVALAALGATSSFTATSHYQLANRLAFLWKLTTLGIPTALVYLGFIGDKGLSPSRKPFLSDRQWRQTFEAYAGSVLQPHSVNASFKVNGTPALFLLRSRTVLSESPRSLSN